MRGGASAVQPFQNNETSQYSRFHRAPIVMRTACLVIAIVFFSVTARGYPQDNTKAGTAAGALDQDITVLGVDETEISVPPPRPPGPPQIPGLDLLLPTRPVGALLQPPSGMWAAPPAQWRLKDPSAAKASSQWRQDAG